MLTVVSHVLLLYIHRCTPQMHTAVRARPPSLCDTQSDHRLCVTATTRTNTKRLAPAGSGQAGRARRPAGGASLGVPIPRCQSVPTVAVSRRPRPRRGQIWRLARNTFLITRWVGRGKELKRKAMKSNHKNVGAVQRLNGPSLVFFGVDRFGQAQDACGHSLP